jgi:tetratricopeptide (TPR) repeat protein
MPRAGARAEALARIAAVLIAAGDRARAANLLRRAEEAIGSELNPGSDVSALTAVASVLAMTGEADRAEAMIAPIPWPNELAETMRTVIAAVAAAGNVERAETMVGSIDNPYYRAKALSSIVAALSTTGESYRLAEVVGQVCGLVRTNAVQDLWNQVDVLTSMATALTEAGTTEHVGDLLRYAEEICEKVDDFGYSKRLLAEAWTAVGDLDRAATFACAVAGPHQQTTALVALARGLSAAWHTDRAVEVLEYAYKVARSITDVDLRPDALASVAEGFAGVGDVDQAVRIACAISDRWLSSTTLARLAEILAAAGESETAAAVLIRAERTARAEDSNHAWTIALVAECLAEAGDTESALQSSDHAEDIAHVTTDERPRLPLVCSLATTAALCGDLQRVERLGASITASESRVDLWTAVAKGFATRGQGAQAIHALDRAAPIAFSVGDSGSRYSALAAVVRELAAHGDLDRAEMAANCAVPNLRSGLLVIAVTTAAESADADRAADIVGHVERIIHSSTVARSENALPALVEVLTMAGDTGRAEEVVRSISDDGHRASALEALARAAAATGDLDRANELINTTTGITQRGAISVRVADAAAAAGHVDRAVEIALAVTYPYHRAKALLRITHAVAAAGDAHRAEQIARMITDPDYCGEALLKVMRARPAPVNRSTVAEVLTLTAWYLAMPEVVGAAPGALDAIFGELDVVYGRSADILGGVEEQ